jgi:PAS domain S-box-containing protein
MPLDFQGRATVSGDPKSVRRGFGVRARLLFIVAAVAVPMCLLAAGIIAVLAGKQADAQRQAMMYSAHTIRNAVDAQLGKLAAAGRALSVSPALQAQDLAVFRTEAERAVIGLPGTWIILADPNGRQVVNTSIAADATLPFLPPAGIARSVRAFDTRQIQYVGVVMGPVAGAPVTGVGLPIFRAGQPAYYLLTLVLADTFRDLLDAQALPAGWVAGIVDQFGNYVARSLAHEHWVTTPSNEATRSVNSREGIVEWTSREGDSLTVAFVRSSTSNWAIGVATSREAFEAPVKQTILLAGVIGLAVLVGSILLAAWIARTITAPIRVLESGAAALEHLRPVAFVPTSVPEFDHAMRAFHAASVALLDDIAARGQVEAALRSFIVEAPAAIAMFDRDMRYIVASKRWVEDYRLEGKTIIGRSHYDVFPDIPQHWKEAHRRALAGEIIKADTDLFDHTEGPIWLNWEIRPWYAANGTIGGIVLFTEDITERKRGEVALETFIEEAPAAIAMFDRDMRYLAASRRWLEDYRLDDGAVLGRSHYDVFPDIPQELKDIHSRALAGEVIRGDAYRLDIAGMGPVWINAEIRPWYALDDTIGGVVLFTEDVSERRRAAAALQAFVDEAPAAIAMFDRDMRYVAASRRWIEAMRLGNAVLIGRSHYEVLPDVSERLKEAHRRALAGEVVKAEADRLVFATTGPVWRNWEVRPWHALDGAIGGIVIFVEDITARIEAEQHARDLQAELLHAARLGAAGEVSAALVHELGQPLTSIGNYVETAQVYLRQGGDDAMARAIQGLAAALDSATRAGDVLRSLRRFLRRESTQDWETIDIAELVRESVQLGLAGTRRHGLDLQLAIAPDLPAVVGNPIRLQQAIANLVRNAAEAMAGSPLRRLGVDVTAEAERTMIEVAISDTGPGFPQASPGSQDSFQPFVTSKPAGMGLGLPLARRIAEEHQGRLWMEPNPEGGAILRFVMPATEERR